MQRDRVGVAEHVIPSELCPCSYRSKDEEEIDCRGWLFHSFPLHPVREGGVPALGLYRPPNMQQLT